MRIRNALEWYDQNMHTDYPLVGGEGSSDDVVGRASWSDSGSFSVYLPKSFIVDIQINAPAVDGDSTASRFFISRVYRAGDSLFVEVSYYTGGDSIACALSSAIDGNLRNTNSVEDRTVNLGALPVELTQYNALSRLTGKLVIGSCVDMQTFGDMTFSYEASAIISARVNTFSSSDSTVVVVDDNGVEHKLTDEFTIQPGDGISLAVSDNTLYIERVLTEEEKSRTFTSVDSVVAAVLKAVGNPIYNINGISPDDKGTFYIRGGDCVSVSGNGTGLTLSNTCAKPCCTEEQTVTELGSSLVTLNAAIERLTQYYNTLTTNVGAMQARLSSLIASRS